MGTNRECRMGSAGQTASQLLNSNAIKKDRVSAPEVRGSRCLVHATGRADTKCDTPQWQLDGLDDSRATIER